MLYNVQQGEIGALHLTHSEDQQDLSHHVLKRKKKAWSENKG